MLDDIENGVADLQPFLYTYTDPHGNQTDHVRREENVREAFGKSAWKMSIWRGKGKT